MILQFAFVLTAIIVGARLGGNGRYRSGNFDFCFRFTTDNPSYRCDADDSCCYYCRCLYAGSRRIGPDGTRSRAPLTETSRPNHLPKSPGDLFLFFCSRNRPCRLFCSSGHCRSSPGNQNTPRTSFRNSCHRFPASHYSQSDLCGYRCPFGTFNRIQYLFARYPDHYNSIHAMRRLSRSFVFAKGR